MWVSNGRAFAPPWIELEDRRLDLDEAARVQRVADAAHDRRARVGDVARLGPHDQVDVALPDARLGVGQPLVLVGQRAQRLAGDLRATRRRTDSSPRRVVTTSPVTPTWSPRSTSCRHRA